MAFANNSSANIKLSKSQLSKNLWSGRFLGRLPLPLKNKIYGSDMKALIISKEEMDDIRKIVEPLEESALLMKGVSETIESEAKNEKTDFLACY